MSRLCQPKAVGFYDRFGTPIPVAIVSRRNDYITNKKNRNRVDAFTVELLWELELPSQNKMVLITYRYDVAHTLMS